ncbi:hypothetical protein HPB49_024567 [Dermacentor silvarum]|uniref:Uncharacterized protein n=1 Tax=Dermacentor silvarum TaxID=543639 RepID=A0ACB8CTT3_DERSI|nr:hypothetical protein HPB49_024567 [Dermacentor silvarum]
MDTNDAKEIGNLGVDLDGARGVFTGTLIDYRMPCTASEDTTCQIVSNLTVWNEFLCWIQLELRELPETGRQIGLVYVPDKCFLSATEYHLHRAAAVLYWLLKTHRCVASVHIPSAYSSGFQCFPGRCGSTEASPNFALVLVSILPKLSHSSAKRFIRRLSAGIDKNRTLCHTYWGHFESVYNMEEWFAVQDTARRNSAFVARAAQFLNHGRCDRHCAAGLDRVSRHPALLAELAQVLSIGQVEAADMVQRRFRSIEGLHEFMRLAGVVKGRVTCLPRENGRAQLDDLNDYCWAHVRRYLELDDVSASPSSP